MPTVTRMSQRTALRLLLGAAALGAGAIHLASASAHYEEWAPLGLAFVAAGACQLVWASTVATRDSRAVLLVGGLGSLALVGAYLLSRTVGLPLGPTAFSAEPVGTSDLLCCALELPVAAGALLLARRPRALSAPLGRRWGTGFAGALLIVGAMGGSALASPTHHAHEQGVEPGCPSAPVLTGELDDRGVDRGVTAYFRCRLQEAHADHPHAPGQEH